MVLRKIDGGYFPKFVATIGRENSPPPPQFYLHMENPQRGGVGLGRWGLAGQGSEGGGVGTKMI